MTYPSIPDGPAPTTPLDPGSQMRASTGRLVRRVHAVEQKGAVGTAPLDRNALLTSLLGNAGFQDVEFAGTVGPSNPTSYIIALNGTVPVGFVITAPPSGIIELCWGALGVSSSTTAAVLLGTRVCQGAVLGSGTVQSDIADAQACRTSATGQGSSISRSRPVTGLTAGQPYNVFLMWRGGLTAQTYSLSGLWLSCDPKLR